MKAGSLQELGALREALRRRQAEDRAAAERERARREAEAAQREAFARAVGPVHALPDRGRALVSPPRPAPEPLQRQADERAALQQALSDEVDVESLLLTDDGLSFRRPGVVPDVVARLRRGQWSIQGQIDLHGHTREEAREALAAFVRESHQQGRRCLRVVHGKGHGSPGKRPVLKAKVQRWLAQCTEVVAFTQASGHEGGAGALIVLLDRRR
ncbi:Smr/MutS family protein [Rubrivivax albus]|uniref:DNA mismatch repair protein MutS n=1 Tax=Rubrivivax albus TaxID=2499835 RepID=A0A3S2X4D5_9BURK|nr:Smr/MutS family protein [Rubrivivax albus]RVT54422.1 DNA mismatch repair protein MutS [Rubrivivax albus]